MVGKMGYRGRSPKQIPGSKDSWLVFLVDNRGVEVLDSPHFHCVIY